LKSFKILFTINENPEYFPFFIYFLIVFISVFGFYGGYRVFVLLFRKKTHAIVEFKSSMKGNPISIFFQDNRYCEWKNVVPEAGMIEDKEYGTFIIDSTYIDNKTKNILKNSSLFPESERGIGALNPKIASDFKGIFLSAYLFCIEKNKDQIGTLDILWAISKQKNLVGMIFDEFGVSPEEIERVVEWSQLEEEIKKREKYFFIRKFFEAKG